MVVLLFLLLFISVNAFSQTERRPLLKVGGFVYFTKSEYSGFSVHFEFERTWKQNQRFTSGPRLDYTFTKDLGYNYTGDIGPKVYVGYELKYYPFQNKLEYPYQGVFVGIEPLILMHKPSSDFYRYGPGLGALLGYQHLIKKKYSLGLEGSLIYFQNLNKERPPDNSEDRYYSLYACLKVGIRL